MTDEQTWDPKQYERDAGFVADLGRPVVDLLAPRAGERVLDLGCGDGRLSEHVSGFGCDVLAIDSSHAQVAGARARGLDAEVIDARTLAFENEFHAVFSNAALHWIRPPHPVVDGVRRALRPGGRFVGELGGYGNVGHVRTALHDRLGARGHDPHRLDPWYFPKPEEYRSLLEGHGFAVETMTLVPRPTLIPTDVVGWLRTFAQPFTNALHEDERPAFLHEVRDALRVHCQDPDGSWTLDYVRLRFRAVLPP